MALSRASSSASVAEAQFSNLPVMALREKIVEKVLENRVTLIVGEAGCGKSSQVPQFLLDEHMEPILCTQPRRFAVVAVAKMVAKSRNCELGDEVGYHIGHSKVLSSRSKIIFKTAGVLLDEMRDKGLSALKYKVIILDEVHERSVESDLVLVCVKQFLFRNKDLRVVLMSATADIARYKEYFRNLGRGERVEVLAIPSSNQRTVFQRKVSYLEQVTKELGVTSDNLSEKCCPGYSPNVANANIKPEVHNLIHDLVLYIHANEPDIEKCILIFLPTYHSLLQQWKRLKLLGSSFKVHVLHSSIDTEQALMAMEISKSHRKVILATNIAESSVTIPKVAFVIDSCRSLQVFYDSTQKKDSAEMIWVSKSQAEQRRGRTGRTCDGHVYRLVTRSFYNQLPDYECPAILKLSLRQQVLLICCAESRAINDPKVLLQKALDPPESIVIEDALDLLVHMRALDKTSRGRYEPTYYGQLLASFSLSFDASVLILEFGNIGMLREGILLGVLMDTYPHPILHPFGQENLFIEYTGNYFGDYDNMKKLPSRREMVLMANLCAYQFWQRVFKDKHRLEHLKELLVAKETKETALLLEKIEKEWCTTHNLLQSSLHQICDIYEDVIKSLHLFRPKFLGTADGRPLYLEPDNFEHTCCVEPHPDKETDPLGNDDEILAQPSETMRCVAIPFVASDQFKCSSVAEALATVIKQMRMQFTKDVGGSQHLGFGVNSSLGNVTAPLCVYFVKGSCNRGTQCSFSHSLEAKRTACKFFSSLQGCRNGESCHFSHDLGMLESRCQPVLPLPEDDGADRKSFLRLLPSSSDKCVLILDDSYLRFSLNLAQYIDPARIIVTSPLSKNVASTDLRVFWGLQHPYKTIGRSSIPWYQVQSVLWFPNLDCSSENLARQKLLLQNFFECLAIRVMADALYEVPVILSMNSFRFSQLQVENLGRECFFYLKESFPYDEISFIPLSDTVTSTRQKLVPRATSYVFKLHPPSDFQFNEYAVAFHKQLRIMTEM